MQRHLSTSHLNEEQLVDLYYGGSQEAPEASEHLQTCKACGDDYNQLRALLVAVSESVPVPERGEDYGREVYLRVLDKIEEEAATEVERTWKWQSWFSGWNWKLVGAMAMLVVTAFLAGRFSHGFAKNDPNKIMANAGEVRERVMLVALGDHFDRSQMVLMELTHAQTIPGVMPKADISSEQRFAEDLIADNRLYRQTAAQAGPAGDEVVDVLEELERSLIEIANSPSKLDSKQLEELQQRIEKQGILFKVRVIGSTVREKDRSSATGSNGQVLATGRAGQGKL